MRRSGRRSGILAPGPHGSDRGFPPARRSVPRQRVTPLASNSHSPRYLDVASGTPLLDGGPSLLSYVSKRPACATSVAMGLSTLASSRLASDSTENAFLRAAAP